MACRNFYEVLRGIFQSDLVERREFIALWEAFRFVGSTMRESVIGNLAILESDCDVASEEKSERFE